MKFNANFIASCQIIEVFMKKVRGKLLKAKEIRAELKDEYDIEYIRLILRELRKHGLVDGITGAGGGYYCERDSITLLEIKNAQTFYPQKEEESKLSRLKKKNEKLHGMFNSLVVLEEECLKNIIFNRDGIDLKFIKIISGGN